MTPVEFRILPIPSDITYKSLLIRTIHMLTEYSIPWFDVYHMTGSCVSDPVLVEKDPDQRCNPWRHSSWYVSRMKVQMILNTLCRGCRAKKTGKRELQYS